MSKERELSYQFDTNFLIGLDVSPCSTQKGGGVRNQQDEHQRSVGKTNYLRHNPAMLSLNGTTSTSQENNASIIIPLLLENKNEITDQEISFSMLFKRPISRRYELMFIFK